MSSSTGTELHEKPPLDANGATPSQNESPPSSQSTKDEATNNESAPEPAQHSKTNLTLIMLALCLAVFLAAVDATLITAALPTITKDFGASNSGFAWIGSSYLLALSATAPFWSKVSDIFGRKPIIIIANVIFLAGALIGALSRDLAMLIAGRAIQGAGGGGLITLVEISVGDMFSQRERGLFYGIYGMIWSVSTAIGPLIGGAFTQDVSWRWCFWFNLPFDGLSLIITILFLHIYNPKTPIAKGLAAIDWLGSLLVVGGTLMFLLGLDFGGVDYPWNSATVICLIVFGLVAYAIFAVYERFARYPVIPHRIFGSVSLASTFAVVFCHGLCFMGPVFYLPLYFQTTLGATPILSGVWLLALAIAFALAGIVIGIFIQRTGHYLWIIRGSMALLTLSLGLFISFGPERDWPRIIIFQILVAVGIGANMQTLVICVQALVAPEDIGVATGTLNFVRNLATAVSVVLGQVIFQGTLAGHRGDLTASGIPGDEVQRLVSGGAIAGAALTNSFTDEQRATYAEAVSDSLSKMWIFYTAVGALDFLISFGIRKKELMTSHETTKTGLEAEEAKRKKNAAAKSDSTELSLDGQRAEQA